MKPYKIVLALLITFAILIGVRYNTTHKFLPIEKKAYAEGWVLTHKFSHLYYYNDSADAVLTVDLEGGNLPEGYKIDFYYRPEHIPGYEGEIAYSRYEMKPTVSNPDKYEMIIPNRGRGVKVYYYIELDDPQGNVVVPLTTPGTESDKTAWFIFAKNPPVWLLIAHLAFMFAGFLFIALAFLTSLENLHNSVNNSRLGRQILWIVIFLLAGIFPLGMWMQYQVVGTYYQGWPVGRDIANTLALIVFIYWLLMLILMKGSGFASRPSKNWIQPMLARILTIIGFLASLGLFLVPHNIGEF
jgi:hypothetical protein